jgi:hypothetical protein
MNTQRKLSSLKEIEIVSREAFENLYKKGSHIQGTKLNNAALLPLSLASLCTKEGGALFFLANRVFFSGYLDCTFKKNGELTTPVPRIQVLEEEIDEFRKLLSPLNKEFRHDHKKKQLVLREDAGLYGRLLIAMGIPFPQKTEGFGQQKAYSTELPHYLEAIINGNTQEGTCEQLRRELIKEVLIELFDSRYEIRIPHQSSRIPYINLRSHPSQEQAIEIGNNYCRFLNQSFLALGIETELCPKQAVRTGIAVKNLHYSRLNLPKLLIEELDERELVYEGATTDL